MSKRFLKLTLILVLFVLVAAGCGGSQEDNSKQEPAQSKSTKPDFITIVTSPAGGAWYGLSVAMADVITKEVGIKATAKPSGASVENLKLLDAKQTEIGWATTNSLFEAYEGKGGFNKKMDFLRILFYAYDTPHYLIVRADRGINSWKDLDGKRIAAYPSASAAGKELWEALIDEYGVKAEGLPVTNAGDSVEQVKDGTIDGIYYANGGAFIDLYSSIDVKWIPLDENVVDAVIKKHPAFAKRVDPPGMVYPDQKVQWTHAAFPNVLLVREDLDEETAYNITKSLFNNLDKIAAAGPQGKLFSLKNAVLMQGGLVPYHPGSIKFFKEKGAWK